VTRMRVGLFLGLALHKAVWELMRVRVGAPTGSPRSRLPTSKRLLKYSKVAVLGLLVVQTLFLDLFPISRRPALLRAVGAILYALGLAVAISGRVQLGSSWANLEDAAGLPARRLVRQGIYAYIRHPIYVGDLLLLAGLELALNSWLVLAALLPFLVVLRQVFVEESLLRARFEEYESYSRRTKRFIPLVV